jgi:hypothetical protein
MKNVITMPILDIGHQNNNTKTTPPLKMHPKKEKHDPSSTIEN